ncbi:MAG: cupin [Alphaproteobacteria bacterium]
MLRNIFESIPRTGRDELVQLLTTLAGTREVRIERIVSYGARAPAEGSFVQDWTEVVVLLHGQATLALEEPREVRHLCAGDVVEIAPGRRHVVEETSSHPPAVWLAIHVR